MARRVGGCGLKPTLRSLDPSLQSIVYGASACRKLERMRCNNVERRTLGEYNLLREQK
jgi:hypothetical protein